MKVIKRICELWCIILVHILMSVSMIVETVVVSVIWLFTGREVGLIVNEDPFFFRMLDKLFSYIFKKINIDKDLQS